MHTEWLQQKHTLEEIDQQNKDVLNNICPLGGGLDNAGVAQLTHKESSVAIEVRLDDFPLVGVLFGFADGLDLEQLGFCDGAGPHSSFPGNSSLAYIIAQCAQIVLHGEGGMCLKRPRSVYGDGTTKRNGKTKKKKRNSDCNTM